MSFGTVFFAILAAVLGFFSYSEYHTIKPSEYEQMERQVRERTKAAMMDRIECIEQDSGDWCNRDIGPKKELKFQRDLAWRLHGEPSTQPRRGDWDRPLIWAILSFCMFGFNLREDIRNRL